MLAIERFVGPDEPILWAARPHAAALARPLALASSRSCSEPPP